MKSITCTTIVVLSLLALCSSAFGLQATGVPIELVINKPVVITTQPASQTAAPGNTVTFSVAVSPDSTAPFSYQWSKNGTANPIAGETNATLTLANVQADSAADYQVVVNNVVGTVPSSIAHLTIGTALAATIACDNATPNPHATITFSSTITGGKSPYVFVWQRNGVAIAGATGTSYQIADVTSSFDGSYTLQTTDANATVVTSNTIVLTTNTPIAITAQPGSLTVLSGQGATFSVTATGTAPISYQWKHEGVVLAGKTSSTLNLTNLTPADAGIYTVTVTNVVGPVDSLPAGLTVNGLLTVSLTSEPNFDADRKVHINPSGTLPPTSVTFTAVPGGGVAPYAYQWTKGGTNVASATNATLVVSGADANAGSYNCVVNDASVAKALTIKK